MKRSTAESPAALNSKQATRIEAVPYKKWTPERLRNEGSYWRARILSTAVDLQLFDWLGKTAKAPRAASDHFGGTEEAWRTFLDALSALGLVEKRQRRYANSLFARRYLCSANAVFLLPDHDAWNLWERLPDLLTTGKRPQTSEPFLTDQKRTERLLQALDQDARKIAPYLIERLPLSHAKTLLDVGGGLGSFSFACCRRFPHLHATIVEHPNVVRFTRRAVKKAEMRKRVRVIALDIVKDPLPPGFDLVLISNVLHGQGVKENRALLRSAYRCLNQRGRIVLRDVFMNHAGTNPEWGALFSVLLLLHTPNGGCYALDEVRGWLRNAGFSAIEGPFRSSPLFFDPDSILIAEKR
jgi:3-hydroxy-5-methyl-1-naphthoate 3-O-methyltransferase